MEPAPIRNKPLFYALLIFAFGLLAAGIVLLSLKTA